MKKEYPDCSEPLDVSKLDDAVNMVNALIATNPNERTRKIGSDFAGALLALELAYETEPDDVIRKIENHIKAIIGLIRGLYDERI